MFNTRRVITGAAMCLVVAGAAPAQENPCRFRTVPVTVVDQHGRPVIGLTAADFSVEIKGQPSQIHSVRIESQSRRLVVLLDASGSMAMPPSFWNAAVAQAADALRSSPKRFQAGLVIFNDTVRTKIPVEPDPQQALAALDAFSRPKKKSGLGPKGRTALWDAVSVALTMIDPPEFGDAVYTITDGGDNASHTELKEIRKELQERGVRFFVTYPDQSLKQARLTVEEANGSAELEELVSETGGSLFTFSSHTRPSTSWENELVADYNAMQFVYRLELTFPMAVNEPKSWKLRLARADLKALRLSYPHHLPGCAESTAVK